MPESRQVVLGCASTGAKFTPLNHHPTGENLTDQICSGADIPVSMQSLKDELAPLYSLGCRYYHYHARNFLSREQSTENVVYQAVSRLVQSNCPDMLISFGASRNGREIQNNIGKFGEWERVSQCAIPLHLGGAHFVTTQAAVELQIICDLERRIGNLTLERIQSREFRDYIMKYIPSRTNEDVQLEANSTARGANYGSSSASIQFEVYKQAIEWRNRLHLFHEVEWVQFVRSYAMTRFAIERPEIGLGGIGQLNVTLLFGFSPKLPFPSTYQEFKRIVDTAKLLEYDVGSKCQRRKVTISVGAAVMPHQAQACIKETDIGPYRSERMCALRRLAVYAAQPDSGVDIFRVGMEDTPYEISADGTLLRTSNIRLAEIAVSELARNGVEIETDPEKISDRLALTDVRNAYLENLRNAA